MQCIQHLLSLTRLITLYLIQPCVANISPSEEFRDGLFQGYDDDWDSDFDDQPDDRSQMPPPAQPGAGGGGGMLSVPKNSNQSGSSGDVR